MLPQIESFEPMARRDARLLILGSCPSVKSLAATQYYAHPQNHFWRIMGELCGAGRDLPYAERLRRVQDNRIAIWDVAHRCRREQSADATMTDIEPNDIAGLLERCPEIRAIFCNGRKAEEMFRRFALPNVDPSLHIEYLPSTSPANASISPAEKLRAWRALERWM